jgi:methyltransferase (TIGR00027 family)
MSAFGAAAMRARHLIVDGHPKIFNDHFAQKLLGMNTDQIVSITNDALIDPSLDAAWVLRSRFAEDRLGAARTCGVHQYVILGAGLDSYALRNAESLDDLIVYEVDDPQLQQWKRKRIEELHFALPLNLRFVACDFETASLVEALAKSKFDAAAPAIVSWLGVTQYLTHEAIFEILRWAASLAAGAEIVLTYVVPGEIAEAQKNRLALRGVRFETFFTPDEISSMLKQAGLIDVQQLSPEEAQKAYFQGRTDGLSASEVERLIVGKSR